MHKRQKLSIREIARLTGVSRNTVTKHLAANTIEPKFATPERQSKIDPFAEKLAGWLKTEAGKSRKQRRTMKQLHSDLVALGFTGSYARVAAFARRWRADRQHEQQTTGRGTFVPLHFDPGDAFQFDWSEDFAVLGGERTKLQMAHIKLSHSRAFLLRAYPLQTHEMLFDACQNLLSHETPAKDDAVNGVNNDRWLNENPQPQKAATIGWLPSLRRAKRPAAIPAPPDRQQRPRNPIPPRGCRALPITAQALLDDPDLVLVRPVPTTASLVGGEDLDG